MAAEKLLRTVFLPHRIPYRIGLDLQQALVSRRVAALSSPDGTQPNEDLLLLLEHRPVYTAGRRERDQKQLEQEAQRLTAFGADYVAVQRGGQTTYHGPGQLVGYPIVDLNAWQMPTRRFVELLQSSLRTVVTRDLGIPTVDSDNTGVFVSSTSKIASIGLQLQRRVTMHGFALNVEDQVKPWFSNIVACGLADVSATTVESERRERDLRPNQSVRDVADLVQDELGQTMDRRIVPLEQEGPLWDIVHDAIRKSEKALASEMADPAAEVDAA